VKKSGKVANFFRDHIKRDFTKLLEAKKNKQEFRKSISRLEKTISLYLDDILNDDELIYILFRGRSIDELSSKSGIPRYFYHSINVTIFALELLQNSRFATGIPFEKQDLINITKLSLLHDIGAIENLGQYVEIAIEKQKEYYFQDIRNSFLAAKMINLDDDLISTLKSFSEYHQGKIEVLFKEDGNVVNYTNILVTADLMDMQISGLFEAAVSIKSGVDRLYTLANNKILRKGYVDALAKGLKLNDLFDFYYELERLTGMCPLKKYARPYPMLGFKSPVLFLCAGHRSDCEHFAKSSKSVNLIRPSSGLQPGNYGRCKLLSIELQKFYESHYDDIKENIILRQEETKTKHGKK